MTSHLLNKPLQYTLTNISGSKGNQAMKFGLNLVYNQSIEKEMVTQNIVIKSKMRYS